MRIRYHWKRVIICAVFLAIAQGAQAMSRSMQADTQVTVECISSQSEADHNVDAICAALLEVLEDENGLAASTGDIGDARNGGTIYLRATITQASPTAIDALIGWSDCRDGACSEITERPIGMDSADSIFSPDSYRSLARSMIRIADLPI
jgi:hypothetical protein